MNFKEPETAQETLEDEEGEGFESPELTDYQEAAVRHPGFSRGEKNKLIRAKESVCIRETIVNMMGSCAGVSMCPEDKIDKVVVKG